MCPGLSSVGGNKESNEGFAIVFTATNSCSYSVPLIGVYFEEHFHTPINELRRRLRITTPPPVAR